jgi:hypothetical protein
MMLQIEVRNEDVTSLSYEMKMKRLSKELWWYLFLLLTKEATSWIGLVPQNKL